MYVMYVRTSLRLSYYLRFLFEFTLLDGALFPTKTVLFYCVFLWTMSISLGVFLYRNTVPVELRKIIFQYFQELLEDDMIHEVSQWFSENESEKRNCMLRFGHIFDWDTSNITNMRYLFSHRKTFNEDISNWDTSQVEEMEGMFYRAAAFNQNLHKWDVSKVWNMAGMFSDATAFNGSLDGWMTNNVMYMQGMFRRAERFNRSIELFYVSNVQNMGNMFFNASTFNQPITVWNTSNVTIMRGLFENAKVFNQPLTNWNTAKVTDIARMFYGACWVIQSTSWSFWCFQLPKKRENVTPGFSF